MGEIILVASGKGGTGKSVFAVNMGAVLADKGYRVVLIDMDMGQGNLDLYLGLHNKVVYNVYDAAMGMCRMRQALIKASRYDCLYLMAAPPHTNDGNVTPERLMAMYEDLKEKFDYIIIDAPAGVESNTMLAATQADRAVIVATPDYASVRGADVLDMKLREAGIDERYYVINKVKAQMMDAEGVPSFGEIGMLIRSKVIGVIPYDDNIDFSVSLGTPAASDSRNIMKDIFIKIARRIIKQ